MSEEGRESEEWGVSDCAASILVLPIKPTIKNNAWVSLIVNAQRTYRTA